MDEEEREWSPPPKRRVERPRHFDITKAHTPLQLRLAELEPYFNWTTKDLPKDRPRYYSLSTQLLKARGESKLMGILQWGKEHRVHIRAIFKVMQRELMNSSAHL